MIFLVLLLAAVLLASCGGDETGAEKPSEEDMETAVRTVTSFLDMCLRGQVEEAMDMYGEFLNPTSGQIFPSVLTRDFDFEVAYAGVDRLPLMTPERSYTTTIVIEARLWPPNEPENLFTFHCSSDGEDILQMDLETINP
jgi:hypothetical protein